MKYLLPALILILVGLGGYGFYDQYTTINDLQSSLTQTESELDTSLENAEDLKEQLARSQEENRNLLERLQSKEDQLQQLSDKVSEITGNVDTLQKLQDTDEELLKKYSKVYFLNEHYYPSKLDPIDSDYLYKDNEIEEIHDDVKPHLEEMIEDAEDDNIELKIISAYRSFDEQSSLKHHYTVTYGAGTANQFSADQGYSEHQLGTTIDFTTPELGTNFTQFDQTEAYEWLQENAHRYGFVLSYAENNSYYQFEPWHWRYVGEELATDLYENDMHFYDMPQREIDEYLVDLFD